MTSVRIDKWLWAARFFKTRALASKACDLGRIHSNGIQAKPAREVRAGDLLQVKNEGGEFQVEVLLLSARRCRNLRRCRSAVPRSAIGAGSFNSAAEDSIRAVYSRPPSFIPSVQ
jgi:ribosomal 50S subunit-recycling heat shock protein